MVQNRRYADTEHCEEVYVAIAAHRSCECAANLQSSALRFPLGASRSVVPVSLAVRNEALEELARPDTTFREFRMSKRQVGRVVKLERAPGERARPVRNHVRKYECWRITNQCTTWHAWKLSLETGSPGTFSIADAMPIMPIPRHRGLAARLRFVVMTTTPFAPRPP
jgi:hypothetical protein